MPGHRARRFHDTFGVPSSIGAEAVSRAGVSNREHLPKKNDSAINPLAQVPGRLDCPESIGVPSQRAHLPHHSRLRPLTKTNLISHNVLIK